MPDPVQLPLVWLSLAVAALPLLAFLLLTVVGSIFHRLAAQLSIGCTGLALAFSVYLFTQVWQQPVVHAQMSWLSLPGLNPLPLGVLLDNLAVLMLVLVCLIALLVQIFSTAYLHADPGYPRYFARLSLFTSAMLAMVLADNLLVLFVFWELVGFTSYLLIGFWRERKSAGLAAMKAFLVNRVADLCLLAGLLLIWAYFGTFDLTALREILSEAQATGEWLLYQPAGAAGPLPLSLPLGMLMLIGLCLVAGCVGKSAQFPLQVWLPDAMEGPTPVSALIHAATMVAAGVYLLARTYFFFMADVHTVMAVIGTLTLVSGAVAAIRENDIKRVLAYSTISQLGYMVMGMGVGAYQASLLHLATHAFFKAGLFLLAGIVIHHLHHRFAHHPLPDGSHPDPQDMRHMGGLHRELRPVYLCYLICAAALVGLPLFSGFLSKDAILAGAWHWADQQNSIWAYAIPDLGFLSVALTAYYMGRQLWLVFLKKPAFAAEVSGEGMVDNLTQNQQVSRVMLWPVMVLAALSFWIWFSPSPLSAPDSWLYNGLGQHLAPSADNTHTHQLLVMLLSIGMALAGLALVYLEVRRKAVATAEAKAGFSSSTGLLTRLSRHVQYLDKGYRLALVKPVMKLAEWNRRFDQGVVDYTVNAGGKMVVVLAKISAFADRLLVDGLVNALARFARQLGRTGPAAAKRTPAVRVLGSAHQPDGPAQLPGPADAVNQDTPWLHVTV